MIFAKEKILRVDLHRMDAPPFPRPKGSLELLQRLGAPPSLRLLWRDFIEAEFESSQIAFLEVQVGYFIALRPYAEDPLQAEALYAPFEGWIEARRQERGYDLISLLRDHDDFYGPEGAGSWLGPWASMVEEALIDPLVIVDSQTFVAVLARLAAFFGLGVQRQGEEEELRICFCAGEMQITLDLGALLFRIVMEGRSFHRGILRYFQRELSALRAAAELLPALSRAGQRLRVHEGRYLEIIPPGAERGTRADLVEVATSHDYQQPEGMAQLLARFQAA